MEPNTHLLPQRVQQRQGVTVDWSLQRVESAFVRVEGSVERIERLVKKFDELEKTARQS